ncbi:hypothetical protein ABPG75_001898 [Micractinium tetrahymenae]
MPRPTPVQSTCPPVHQPSVAQAFTLADALGVDAIIVPPAQHRRSFNHSTTDSSVYYNASASTLLDMPAIRDAWAPLGIRVLEEGVHAEDQEWRGCVAAHLHNPPAPPYVPPGLQTGLGNLIARVRSLIGDAWRSHGTQACVVVHAGELLFALRTQTSANLTAAAAGRLAFAPGIEALALEVADGIGGPYNGAHLRVEKDMGLNPMDVMPNYVAAMQLQAFNASMPVYVASGLLTYNDTQGLQSLSKYMLSSGVASRVVVKEQLLPPADLEGLHSEQRALLDLLVLARAQRFVGHRVSTFSHYTTQYQLLRNGDSSRAALLNHPGTDFWHEFMVRS